jgi:hypothetical protein
MPNHALRLPGAVEDDIRRFDLADCNAALELGTGQTDLVGAFEGTHVLSTCWGDCRCRHVAAFPLASPTLPRRATSLRDFDECAIAMTAEGQPANEALPS